MKNKVFLILVRHAKAVRNKAGQSDAIRALTAKGRRQAREMAFALKAKGPAPALFMSSPARRALETARIFAERFPKPRRAIQKEGKLYSSKHPRDIARLVRALPGECRAAAFFGHNPLFEETAAHFLPRFTKPLRKGSVVVIRFPGWRRVRAKGGTLAGFHTPA